MGTDHPPGQRGQCVKVSIWRMVMKRMAPYMTAMLSPLHFWRLDGMTPTNKPTDSDHVEHPGVNCRGPITFTSLINRCHQASESDSNHGDNRKAKFQLMRCPIDERRLYRLH